jgi:hypothetical protein
MFYEIGNPTECLIFIRRLLLAPEATDLTKTGAISIVEEMLSEYQYDESMLGAIQSAIPVGFWLKIYRGLFVDHALRGQWKAYLALKNQLFSPKKSANMSKFSPEIVNIYDTIASRNGTQFERQLTDLFSKRHNDFILVANDFAQASVKLKPSEFKKIEEYLSILANLLRRDLDQNKSSQQVLDLLTIFDRSQKNNRSAAEKAVRGGVSVVGAVNIRPIVTLTNPYEWTTPPSLSRKNLLVVPHNFNDREWVIE